MNARRTAVTQPRDLKLWLRATLPKGVLRPSDARQSHHFEKSRPTLIYTYCFGANFPSIRSYSRLGVYPLRRHIPKPSSPPKLGDDKYFIALNDLKGWI